VWSFRDITQRLNLEAQLRHAQKMEAVGSLAGGVAHDFNNLLTAIMGHSSLLLTRMGEGDPLREDVAEIHRASERAALLTRQLLSFSRQQLIEPRVLDLNRVVRSMEQMLSRTLGETIRVVLDAAPAPLWIRADAGELEQVMLNLAINARDAMPEGGTLHLQTAPARIEAEETRLELRAGDFARLSFRDDGMGMDRETRLRIFDPFFTTKALGRGTGLGLSAVYGIMKQSGGAIAVESEPGQGARFDLYFPSVASEPERVEAVGAAGAPPRGRGRVLLVEDEDMVRDLLREALSSAGFDVIAASHGPEAIETLERDGAPIDLLVTDVVMPRMSGPELARRLGEQRDGLRVLFISGYTADELSNRVSFERGTGFLQKPFSPPTLILKIHELLETPTTG
jgi:nitrogen-specific signal transduction histidine kinase